MKKKRRRAQPVFKEYNQDQLLLLLQPEELVPNNHVVRLVNKAIDHMNIRSIVKAIQGRRHQQLPSTMMLKVLIYAYTQRIYSSRQIAKALRENIHSLVVRE